METSLTSKPRVTFDFEVEKVLGISADGRYQVQWAPAWVSKFHLVGCQHLIQEFLQKQSGAAESGTSEEACNQTQLLPPTIKTETGEEELAWLTNNNELVVVSDRSKINLTQSTGLSTITKGEQDELDIAAASGDEMADCEEHIETFSMVVPPGSGDLSDENASHLEVLESSADIGGASFRQNDPFQHDNDNIHLLNNTISDSQQWLTGRYFGLITLNKVKNAHSAYSERPNLQANVSPAAALSACPQTLKEPSPHPHIEPLSHKRDVSCKVSSKSIPNRRDSKHHIGTQSGSSGDKSFTCDQCGYSCSTKSNLIVHKRKHTGEKPFQCEHCGKRFSQKGTLVTHTRLHTGDKPYECHVCGKSFPQHAGLKQHSRKCTSSSLTGTLNKGVR